MQRQQATLLCFESDVHELPFRKRFERLPRDSRSLNGHDF